jgi:hypothetical protein
VGKGIINGYGDGNFGPDDQVTANQLAKMLLCATGYGKDGEYTGSEWELNAAIDGYQKGIFTGSTAADFSFAATREEAALYIFNAMTKIEKVAFDTTTKLYVPVDGTPAVDNTLATTNGLAKVNTVDANGVAGYVWQVYGVAVTEVATTDTVLGTSMNGTNISLLLDRTKTTWIASPDAAVAYFVNGSPVADYDAADTYAIGDYVVTATGEVQVATANGVGPAANFADAIVPGVIVNLLDSNDAYALADKIAITIKRVDVLAATPVVTPVLNSPSAVAINLTTDTDIAGTTETVVGYDGLVLGDVVLYYVDALGITHIEKAESVTAQLTAYNATTGIYTIGGSAKTVSGLANADAPATGAATDFNADIVFYFDNGGYLVEKGAVVTDPVDINYALVLNYEYTSLPSNAVARLVLADGSIVVVSVAAVNGVVPNQTANFDFGAQPYAAIVTYTVNDAGQYTLTPATEVDVLTNNVNYVDNANALSGVGAPAGKYLTSNTLFFYFDAVADEYTAADVITVKQGYLNAEAFTAQDVTYVLNGTNAALVDVVLIQAPAAAAAVGGNYAFFADKDDFSVTYVGVTPYYVHNVYINGAAATLTLDAAAHALILTDGLWTYELTGAYVTGATTAVVAETIVVIDATYVQTNAATYSVNASTVYVNVTGVPTTAASLPTTATVTGVQTSLGVATYIYFTV